MNFNDPQVAQWFKVIVDDRIDQKIKELKFDRTYSATVISVGSGVANIQLQGGTSTINGVPNKSGETLVIGDEIYIEAINNSLNNLVIKYKK